MAGGWNYRRDKLDPRLVDPIHRLQRRIKKLEESRAHVARGQTGIRQHAVPTSEPSAELSPAESETAQPLVSMDTSFAKRFHASRRPVTDHSVNQMSTPHDIRRVVTVHDKLRWRGKLRIPSLSLVMCDMHRAAGRFAALPRVLLSSQQIGRPLPGTKLLPAPNPPLYSPFSHTLPIEMKREKK